MTFLAGEKLSYERFRPMVFACQLFQYWFKRRWAFFAGEEEILIDDVSKTTTTKKKEEEEEEKKKKKRKRKKKNRIKCFKSDLVGSAGNCIPTSDPLCWLCTNINKSPTIRSYLTKKKMKANVKPGRKRIWAEFSPCWKSVAILHWNQRRE